MKIMASRMAEGQLRLDTGRREMALPDGVYRRADGTNFIVRHHEIVEAFLPPDLEQAPTEELVAHLDDLSELLASIDDDAQRAHIDLQNQLQKMQQTLQSISNVSKMMHDTSMAVIRRIG